MRRTAAALLAAVLATTAGAAGGAGGKAEAGAAKTRAAKADGGKAKAASAKPGAGKAEAASAKTTAGGPKTPERSGLAARIAARIAEAERLFAKWRYEEAFDIAEALYAEHPGIPSVQYLAGKAKFYQQDYQGAVALLERATAGSPEGETTLLAHARAAHELTGGFVATRSEHFELRVKPGVDEILVPYALDALEKAYRNVGDDFGWHPPRRVVVEAYDRAENLSAVSGLPVDAIKNTGTIAICKHNKLMFTSPKALLLGYEWLDTLSHEYIHYVVSRVSHNTVPIWLHEGLAKYEETRWSGPAGRALSPWSERLLTEAVRGKRRFITFEEMHPSMALLPTQEDASLAFAEVFTAIQYLVEARGGYPAMRAVIDRLKNGDSDQEAFAAVLKAPFSRFERDWRAWLKRRPLRADADAREVTVTFKEDVKGKAAGSAEEATEGEADVEDPLVRRHDRLGDLLRRRDRYVAAAVEYEKAYAVAGPRSVQLPNKLAVTYMKLENWQRAETVLEESVGPNPTYVPTHVHLGRLYHLTDRPELAEAALLRANEINPFDPEIHLRLYDIWKARGDEKLVERARDAVARLTAPRSGRSGSHDAAEAGATGWLSITSTPWARVTIDGADTGLTTPVFEHALPPGEYEIVLENEASGARKALKVEIAQGETRKLSVELD